MGVVEAPPPPALQRELHELGIIARFDESTQRGRIARGRRPVHAVQLPDALDDVVVLLEFDVKGIGRLPGVSNYRLGERLSFSGLDRFSDDRLGRTASYYQHLLVAAGGFLAGASLQNQRLDVEEVNCSHKVFEVSRGCFGLVEHAIAGSSLGRRNQKQLAAFRFPVFFEQLRATTGADLEGGMVRFLEASQS